MSGRIKTRYLINVNSLCRSSLIFFLHKGRLTHKSILCMDQKRPLDVSLRPLPHSPPQSMVIKCQVSVSILLLNIPKVKTPSPETSTGLNNKNRCFKTLILRPFHCFLLRTIQNALKIVFSSLHCLEVND